MSVYPITRPGLGLSGLLIHARRHGVPDDRGRPPAPKAPEEPNLIDPLGLSLPGRLKADGTPNFVRRWINPVSGRLAGEFPDGGVVDAEYWTAQAAASWARLFGEQVTARAHHPSGPALRYVAEIAAERVGADLRAQAAAALWFVVRDLRLPRLGIGWFGATDRAGYERAQARGDFAEAHDPDCELWGLHDEDDPDRLYLSAAVVDDGDILANVAHEARHAYQTAFWPEASRRGPTGRERQEADAQAYSLGLVRTLRIVRCSDGAYTIGRR